MKKFMEWLSEHEWMRRALRTFLQAFIGVVAAAVANASGVIDDLDGQAVIMLAVSTGMAAVMNVGKGGGNDE